MANLYIHIPFCKVACSYCDFHFSTNLTSKKNLVETICKEIFLKRNRLKSESIQTIYFGGGTPGVLHSVEIEKILNSIVKHCILSKNVEVSFEINPDNISKDYLESISRIGINRLSVGIQSIYNEELRFMKRTYSSQELFSQLEILANSSFVNYSFDVMFGSPFSSQSRLKHCLKKLMYFLPKHFSVYGLTVEKKTLLSHWVKQKSVEMPTDIECKKQYFFILGYLEEHGFMQYEISNFCLTHFKSKHNSSYWENKPYIGVGPSAHSFDGIKTRYKNISNNHLYIQSLQSGTISEEEEVLSVQNTINETLITRLRTRDGIVLNDFVSRFGKKELEKLLMKINFSSELVKSLEVNNEAIKIKKPYLFISDNIISKILV